MKVLHTTVACTFLAAAVILMASPQVSHAQDRDKGTVVAYPVVFAHNSGDDTSRKTGIRSIHEALEKAGCTLISDRVAANTWRKLALPMPTSDEPARRTDMVRLGTELQARYAVSAVILFHTRSI